MIPLLISSALEIAIAIVVIYTIYSIFFSDWIARRRAISKAEAQNKENKTQEIEALVKLTKVKLVSNNDKEIEEFIAKNVKLLPDLAINALVNRIELIRADRVIAADSLDARIEKLAVLEAQAQEEAKPPAKRRKNG